MDADSGFGFIADDSGGSDVFLHTTSLEAAGIDPDQIKRGNWLTFDVEVARDGRTKASNVRPG